MGKITIDTLGTNFTIQSNEDEEHMRHLLSYYLQMVKQAELSSKLKDPIKNSIIAGLMLCDELYKEKTKSKNNNSIALKETDLTEAERLTQKMISNIDKVLA